MNPFTDDPAATLGACREEAIIERIRELAAAIMPAYPEGIGDDASVLSPERSGNVISNDSVNFGIHFDEQAAPELVGRKLVNRNLSDLAAMGAEPRGCLLACHFSKAVAFAWFEGFIRGLAEAADSQDLALCGGDVARLESGLATTLTVWGHARRPVLRREARPGDAVLATGCLGGSILGRHLTFQPRLREGIWLAGEGRATSMIDITDGVIDDLGKLVPVGCAAVVDTDSVPIHPDAQSLAESTGRTALDHALTDGEDYELLLTVPQANVATVLAEWADTMITPLTRIGHIRKTPGAEASAKVVDQELRPLTPLVNRFRHFA